METALILAGGESARFGRPKAFVDVGGKSMVRRVADAIAPLAGEIVVSVATGEMAEALRSVLPGPLLAVDRQHGRGPIEGIARGFEIAHGDRILVAPCDAPLLRTQVYRLLLGALGDHEASVPMFDVFDPVRAVYRKAAVLRVLAAPKTPLPSPSSMVDRLDAVFVGAARLRTVDPRLDSFLDVNRESDLAEVLVRLKSP